MVTRLSCSHFYRPYPKDDGRLCFHMSLSLNREGTPERMRGYLSFPMGGGGTHPRLGGDPPIGTGWGTLPVRTGWGTPPPWEWMVLGQVMLRAVRLLRFPAEGLSCLEFVDTECCHDIILDLCACGRNCKRSTAQRHFCGYFLQKLHKKKKKLDFGCVSLVPKQFLGQAEGH